MKKLKTFLCLLICLALMCGSLVACSSSSSKKSSKKSSKVEKDEDDDEDEDEDDDDEDDDDEDDAKPTKKPSKNDDEDDDDDDDAKPTKKPSKNDDEDDDDDDVVETKKPDKKPASSSDLSIDEEVIFDDGEFKVTAVSIKEDSWYGYQLELLLENGSDESVEFNCDYFLINNCVVNSYLWEDVKAGGKTYATIPLYTEDLYNNYGISTIGQLDFAISADNDDWDTVMESGPISIKTSLYDNMDEPKPFSDGIEVVDEDGITMVAKMGDSDDWSTEVMIYCENNTDVVLYVTTEYVTINGFDVSANIWMQVPAGAVSVNSISIYSSTLEDNHIDEIESLSFALKVRDYDSYKELFVTDEIEMPID